MKYEHYQEYLKRIPGLKAKPVPISLDEWAYIGAPPNSYKVVPAYAWAFHEMFRHSDLYQLGAFTFATAMISEDRTDAVLSPTGLLFKMYREHFRHDSGGSIRKFAAAQADLSSWRRPARSQSGQRYVSSGCERCSQ